MQESVPYESQIEESKQEERNMFKKKYDLDELDWHTINYIFKKGWAVYRLVRNQSKRKNQKK